MTFTDQQESNNIITDLETLTGFAREDFSIFPEERSAIFGDLDIGYTVPGYEGKTVNLTSHPDGVLIGPAVTSSEFIKTTANKVIAIEKGALFTRFIEENVHNKHKSLLDFLRWTSAKANPKLHTPTPRRTRLASLHFN